MGFIHLHLEALDVLIAMLLLFFFLILGILLAYIIRLPAEPDKKKRRSEKPWNLSQTLASYRKREGETRDRKNERPSYGPRARRRTSASYRKSEAETSDPEDEDKKNGAWNQPRNRTSTFASDFHQEKKKRPKMQKQQKKRSSSRSSDVHGSTYQVTDTAYTDVDTRDPEKTLEVTDSVTSDSETTDPEKTMEKRIEPECHPDPVIHQRYRPSTSLWPHPDHREPRRRNPNTNSNVGYDNNNVRRSSSSSSCSLC